MAHETYLITIALFPFYLLLVKSLKNYYNYEQLYDYFVSNNLLSDRQFGFRQFHSTASTLLDSTNEWFINMDRGKINIAVFLDLQKAFDTINHDILQCVHLDYAKPRLCNRFVYSYPFSKLLLDETIYLYRTKIRYV